jgi:hypothetical protein
LGEEEGAEIGEESRQPIGSGEWLTDLGFHRAPTRLGKECDPNEKPLLPLPVGPSRAWSQPSLTHSKRAPVQKETTISDGSCEKWDSKITVACRLDDPDSFAPSDPLVERVVFEHL